MSFKSAIKLAFFVLLISFLFSLWFAKPWYFGTNDKELNSLENDFFLSDPNKVFLEQLKFRDSVVAEFEKNLAALNNTTIDSLLGFDSTRRRLAIKYLLPNTKYRFVIPLNNYTLNDEYYLVGYDSLIIQTSIDEDKINSINQKVNVSPREFATLLKLQDYIKIEKKATFHFRIIALVIFFGSLIFIYALLYFLIVDLGKPSESESILSKNIFVNFYNRLKSLNKKAEEKLKDVDALEKIKNEFINELDILKKQFSEFEKKNTAYFIVESIVKKAEAKSKEVHNRATLMLVSGLIMAFIGVIIFYFTLPANIATYPDMSKIIVLSIRPALILIFVESVAWYLIRQHKALLDDYRYFHSIYNKKIGYLAAHQLILEKENPDEKLKSIIPLMILSEEIKSHETKEASDSVETSNNLLTTLYEKLLKTL